MAITPVKLTEKAAQAWSIDTTGTIATGDASAETVGTKLFQLYTNGATISFKFQGLLAGAEELSMDWQDLAYQNMTSGEDVAGTTAVTANGIYAVRCDVGMKVRANVSACSDGTAYLIERRGRG